MDFYSAIQNLQFYLDNQSFLQKVSSFEDLKLFKTPAISLLLTPEGEVFYLPEDKLFKKAIFFFDEDPAKIAITKDNPRPTFSKQNSIQSSLDLFDNAVNNKLIKSAYWELFSNYSEIDYGDCILILKKKNESNDVYNLLVIKGPMNESYTVPEFLSSANLLTEITYPSTPHTRPPMVDLFLPTYRHLKDSPKINWDPISIMAYLGSIWNERSPSTTFSRLNLLFESVVLIAEKNEVFNKFLQIDKDKKAMVGIPSNFIIGICGGYARGEYSKKSDLDMLLIHEGNDKQFIQVGEALDQVLQHVRNLELCKMENLNNLNFHEDSISNILRAFLKGNESYLGKKQKYELEKMLESIETLRQAPLPPEEQRDGISKYCWSIYKSIINMVPVYEKPIGKGEYLRRKITKSTKKSLHKMIPILLRITDSLNEEKDILGESLRVCQPYVLDSIFKKYSVLTALQDVSTILNILSESTFTSSTIERFKMAMEKNIITEEQCNMFIQGYAIFSRAKYKLTKEIPIESLELINSDIRYAIIEVYENILQNLELEEDEMEVTIAYPLLVFSDLHWGLNIKLARKCLAQVKKICDEHQVRSIIIAGDVLNIDRVNELEESDIEGISLLNELSQIQNSLGDQRIHIISGNHDQENFYSLFCEKMIQELDIHFLGYRYKDEKIWIEHGDLNFWKNFTPPLDQYISKFRINNKLRNQKIIVGHIHRIYEEEESGFYANGSIGKSFSSVLIKEESIKLIKLPIEYSFDFDKILAEYPGIKNADTSINDYVQNNFDLVEWDQFTSSLVENNSSQKKTCIVTEQGVPTGLIPFNKTEDISKLENIQVYEVAFPIYYTFKLGQTLKEAWRVFSVTGDSILPVMNQENQIVGTLSIFSVPKPEKEHIETKDAIIDEKMESVGNFLTQKLLEKQKRMK